MPLLILVEEKQEKILAQKKMEGLLQQAWPRSEDRDVVWRPSKKSLRIAHNRSLWFASASPGNRQNTPRYWNSFGIYSDSGGLEITVEINIPTTTNSKQVSGFFARDPVTGVTYLLHDGGIGGGRKGIGQTAFLAWLGADTVEVQDSSGKVRHGLIVTPLIKANLGDNIARFINAVSEFKEAAANENLSIEAIGAYQSKLKAYYKEFSGRKAATRKKEIEYISRHGDVVHELYLWRSMSVKRQDSLVKNTFVDLAVSRENQLVEIYEVKTSASRQGLYTAIGQILVHESPARPALRYLVIPDNEAVAGDIVSALERLKIGVITYGIKNGKIKIPSKNFG